MADATVLTDREVFPAMDELEKRMLKEVAELDALPVGVFNIGSNGKSESRNSTAYIQIESRESGDGINVYFKDGTKNESCHIPVIISKSGHKETVFNEFFIGEDCDVTIVAGCGISNCGGMDSEHDGIHIDYICPVNEPDGYWNWQGPKQEGTPATNRETARIARATAEELRRLHLGTEVLVNESSDLRCLLGIYNTTWERGNTIRTFFSPDSTYTYLGQTSGIPRLILGHSYWTNTPIPYMRKIREQLRDTLARYGARFWQSELCIMQNDEEIV